MDSLFCCDLLDKQDVNAIIILIMSLQTTPTISAMALRKGPGRFLDRVEYRKERFVVERAGKPKAALVPLTDLKQMQKRQSEARARLFEKTQEIRRAFAGMTEEETDRLVGNTVSELRSRLSKFP